MLYFSGRPDGIGNRIEELIYIQEYCINNNLQCTYIWNNTNFRNYLPLITFDNIDISTTCCNEKFQKNIFQRSPNFNVRYRFNFNIDTNILYDTIIHIRATDRINTRSNHPDNSSTEELYKFIDKVVQYVNTNSEIRTYTIVSDDSHFIKYAKENIVKKFISLKYDYAIPTEWLDYYYLTKPQQSIIMCCKFSSYSITASILAEKPLLCLKDSSETNLSRYKANVKFIS